MARKVKRKKLRIFRFLLLILIVILLIVSCELYLNTKIKNIIVKGTTYLKDDYILKEAGIIDYPSFYFTPSFSMKNKLKKSPFIKEVNINKKFYHLVQIEIKENS